MINVGINLQDISVDPFTNGNFQQLAIVDLIFDPLVYIDENLNTVGCLAEKWEVNRTGDVFKFFLKKDIKFHDGSKFTSADVVETFARHLRRDSKSFWKNSLQEILKQNNGDFISSIKALDPYTVEFQLKGAYPPFLENLASVYIAPHNFNPAKPIGSGPLRVTSTSKDDITLEKVPSYKGPPAHLQTVKFILTQTDQFADKLKKGELDLTLQAPLELAIDPPNGYSVFTSNFDLVSVIFYFNFDKKIFQDPKTRHYIRRKLLEAREFNGFLTKFDKKIDHLIPL